MQALTYNELNEDTKLSINFKLISSSTKLLYSSWFRFMYFYWNFRLSLSVFFLPIKNRLISLIKSPFIYKKSGRQFFQSKCASITKWLFGGNSTVYCICMARFFKLQSNYVVFRQQLSKTDLNFNSFNWRF